MDSVVSFLLRETMRSDYQGLVLHTLNLAHWDLCHRHPDYFEIYRQADIVLPDGWPIVSACRKLGFRSAIRIPGADLTLNLLKKLPEESRVFLLGTKPDLIRQAAKRLNTEYGCKAMIEYHHGYFSRDAEVIPLLQTYHPHVLVLGMGSPRQETWLAENRRLFRFKVAICAGGTLDIVAGRYKLAPHWIRTIGLEWLFRWSQRPIQLSRRYFVEGPVAFWHLRAAVKRALMHSPNRIP